MDLRRRVRFQERGTAYRRVVLSLTHGKTFGWPTTAGVWLYHDHSICDMENVQQGAIGLVVIRNPGGPGGRHRS